MKNHPPYSFLTPYNNEKLFTNLSQQVSLISLVAFPCIFFFLILKFPKYEIGSIENTKQQTYLLIPKLHHHIPFPVRPPHIYPSFRESPNCLLRWMSISVLTHTDYRPLRPQNHQILLTR